MKNHTTETSTNEKTLCMDGQTNSIRLVLVTSIYIVS